MSFWTPDSCQGGKYQLRTFAGLTTIVIEWQVSGAKIDALNGAT